MLRAIPLPALLLLSLTASLACAQPRYAHVSYFSDAECIEPISAISRPNGTCDLSQDVLWTCDSSDNVLATSYGGGSRCSGAPGSPQTLLSTCTSAGGGRFRTSHCDTAALTSPEPQVVKVSFNDSACVSSNGDSTEEIFNSYCRSNYATNTSLMYTCNPNGTVSFRSWPGARCQGAPSTSQLSPGTCVLVLTGRHREFLRLGSCRICLVVSSLLSISKPTYRPICFLINLFVQY